MSIAYRQIFNICKRAGLLNEEQVKDIFDQSYGRSPVAVAQELHYTTEEDIAKTLAAHYRCEYCDIEEIEQNPQAIMSLPLDTDRKSVV